MRGRDRGGSVIRASGEPRRFDLRDRIFDSRDPADVFARVAKYLGRPPTSRELRVWVNTALGPWHIPSEVCAMCADDLPTIAP